MAINTQYQAYQRQFEDTLIHLYELNRPYLIDAMKIETEIEGESKVYDRIGQLTYQKKTGRNEVANLSEPEYSARHLTVDTYYVATPLDMEDVGKMVNNPQDDLYQEAVNAIYDAQTDVAMSSFFDDVIINADGGATASFPAANQIAVDYSGGTFGQNSGAANVGLNIDKLLNVRSKISNSNKIKINSSDDSSLHIAITEDDMQSLMANKIGTDNFPLIDRFNSMQASFQNASETIEGGMFRWGGFTFHVVPPQYFLLDANGDRRLPVWVKNGMCYGMKQNVSTEILRLPQTVESTKIQALTRVGGLRKHDDKVYEIKVAV